MSDGIIEMVQINRLLDDVSTISRVAQALSNFRTHYLSTAVIISVGRLRRREKLCQKSKQFGGSELVDDRVPTGKVGLVVRKGFSS